MSEKIAEFDIIFFKNLREKQILSEMQNIMRVIGNYMAVPLFLVFWVADLIYVPDQKWHFLFLRCLILPICVATNFFIGRISSFKKTQAVLCLYTISLAALVNVMILKIPDIGTSYYSGLNLVSVGCLSFIPYSTGVYFLTAAGIYLPYFLITASKVDSFTDLNGVVVNLFFIVGTVVICSVIRFFNEKLRVAELIAKAELNKEIYSRDKIISEKTSEAVNLHALSAQFSPQVVKAIKDGKINLQEGVHRSKICAIFIDIVNSTERVVRLDQDKVQIVLARFLDTTLTTFLKYDLTIDKFHGDGVLAFSNDPIKRDDFIERACLAAIEVRDAIALDQAFYILNWKSEMEVRIGIATGFANVGFYGDKKYFRSFTAIGAPLPFASRLTSIAQPNQILVDAEIASLLLSQKFVVNLVGERKLKGFDQDKNIVYSLEMPPLSSAMLGGAKTCPNHADTVLHLDTNLKGHFTFKCRECGYEDTNVENTNSATSVVKKVS